MFPGLHSKGWNISAHIGSHFFCSWVMSSSMKFHIVPTSWGLTNKTGRFYGHGLPWKITILKYSQQVYGYIYIYIHVCVCVIMCHYMELYVIICHYMSIYLPTYLSYPIVSYRIYGIYRIYRIYCIYHIDHVYHIYHIYHVYHIYHIYHVYHINHMNLSIYLSICLSVYLSIYLSIYLTTNQKVHSSITTFLLMLFPLKHLQTCTCLWISQCFPVSPWPCQPWCPVSTTHRAPPPISVAPKASPQLRCRGPRSAPREPRVTQPHPGACREAPRRWRRRNAWVTTSGLRSWYVMVTIGVKYGEMLGFTVGFNFGLILVDYSLNVLMDVDGESRIVLNFLSGTSDLVKKQIKLIKLKTVKKQKRRWVLGKR